MFLAAVSKASAKRILWSSGCCAMTLDAVCSSSPLVDMFPAPASEVSGERDLWSLGWALMMDAVCFREAEMVDDVDLIVLIGDDIHWINEVITKSVIFANAMWSADRYSVWIGTWSPLICRICCVGDREIEKA